MRFFERFADIFVSPGRVFAEIREGTAPWWQPWIMLAAIQTAFAAIGRPIGMAVMELNAYNLSPEDMERQMNMVEKFGFVQVASVPFALLAYTAAVAGLTYVMVSIFAQNASFKKYFTINLYAGVISGLTQVVSTVVVLLRGVDNIDGPQDAFVSASLRFLAPADNTMLRTLLGSIELFTLWSLALVAVGLVRVFDIPRDKAIICVIPIWLIGTVALFLSEVASSLG